MSDSAAYAHGIEVNFLPERLPNITVGSRFCGILKSGKFRVEGAIS